MSATASPVINRGLIEGLQEEAGGVVHMDATPAFSAEDWSLILNGPTGIAAGPGHGTSAFLQECIVQALALGRPVRVVCFDGEFHQLVGSLGGVVMTQWDAAVWNDLSLPLVLADMEAADRSRWPDILEAVEATPAACCVIESDPWFAGHQPVRPNIIGSLDVSNRPIRIQGTMRPNDLPPELSPADVTFLLSGIAAISWRWVLLTRNRCQQVYFLPSLLRRTVYQLHRWGSGRRSGANVQPTMEFNL